MGQKRFQVKSALALALALLLWVTWTACSTVKGRPADPTLIRETGEGKYYFFEDVLIPKELNYKASDSFIYETSKFKAGWVNFSGWWVDAETLVKFFNTYMGKDNWKLINSFRGKEYLLNFSKPDKTCTIKIVDKWYGSVHVEIRVGPLA